jgi:hypothetical protein
VLAVDEPGLEVLVTVHIDMLKLGDDVAAAV